MDEHNKKEKKNPNIPDFGFRVDKDDQKKVDVPLELAGMEHLTCKETLTEQELLSLKKERFRGIISM